MYRKILPIALTALFSVMMIGCTEDPLSPDNPTMKAEVDGTSKETTSVTAIKFGSTMNIQGSFSDGTNIAIGLTGVTDPTTITLPSTGNTASFNIVSPLKSYIATEGEVEITSIDETGITGNFSFKGLEAGGSETIEVKDGAFSAKFQ
ncbi:MAG: hypothetical protein KDD67_06095 [Ignavibacteriae bacterium]|nr:hypothetical protein [Ignavibacteriota bacterium]MCB9215315.1 hypothetical protein [Ignavibacteria bacterium]